MNNVFATVVGGMLALGTVTAFAAAKKTPWGDPDLQGTYTTDNSIGVPLQRPEQFGTRATLTDEEYAARVSANDVQVAKDKNPLPESEFAEDSAANNAPRHWLERPANPSRASSLIIDPPNGRMPALTPEGEKRAAAQRAERRRGLPASYKDFSNYDRCISRGVAASILPAIYGNGTKIEQAPGYIVIQNEMIHETRVIPLDARAHVGAGVRSWMGDSRGHFEGDTLVIETTNLNGRTASAASEPCRARTRSSSSGSRASTRARSVTTSRSTIRRSTHSRGPCASISTRSPVTRSTNTHATRAITASRTC